MNIEIIKANYQSPQHAKDIVALLDGYARDPMGGGQPLTPEVKDILIANMDNFPGALSILCYVDGKAVGLANCILGFSTFKAKPLLNVHDIAVVEGMRGQGIGQKLLEKVEEEAIKLGCCKITLEVLEGNTIAQKAYRKYGFNGYELDSSLGTALFWEKSLD